jgi:hypothetical protein
MLDLCTGEEVIQGLMYACYIDRDGNYACEEFPTDNLKADNFCKEHQASIVWWCKPMEGETKGHWRWVNYTINVIK